MTYAIEVRVVKHRHGQPTVTEWARNVDLLSDRREAVLAAKSLVNHGYRAVSTLREIQDMILFVFEE